MRSREDADAWGWAPPSKHRSLGGRPLRTSSLPRPVPGGGQEQTDTWSLGGERPEGSKPHKRQGFLQLFPLFRFFSISSDINFVCAVVVLFLKRNHIWSWFSADTGTRGGTRQTQTCDRQAVRPRAAGLQTPSLSRETSRGSSETGRTEGGQVSVGRPLSV